ncbi:MAG: DUF3775 domain-containing protein [Beijerinckiaceae bacterium]|nr:DUF3775 domain-containing protein [Beijerinckiaceae bacterium]
MDIAIDKIRALIVEARRIDVKEADTDPDSGSNPIDDGETDVLTSSEADEGEDATEIEFRGMIDGMNDDERADVIALVYLGRGDFDIEEWDDAVALARERDEASGGDTASYLLGIPNLGDLLDEGLAAHGDTLEDDGTPRAVGNA